MEEYQHYAVWKCFNTEIYKKTLTSENIVNNGNEKYIETVFEVISDGLQYRINEGKGIKTKCVFLEKNGIKYILPAHYIKQLPINVVISFDCYLKQSDTTIYKFITLPKIAKIEPLKTFRFKDLIAAFNPMQHTDAKTWTFLKVQAIASKYKGSKYRLCSVPACGKNANDVILHMITNDNVRVSKPTLAKLETLFYFNQKVLPDEMTSLTSTQVREIEPFFLSLADESPTFTKHSMARRKDMNEVNISAVSCVFTYNDPNSIQQGSKFFDHIWQSYKAFDSRYPALYLQGEIVSSMPKLSQNEAEQLMVKNYEKLRLLSKNIVYYIHNLNKELHGYDTTKFILNGRQRTNFESVLDGLDAYSETQQEFDDWIEWVNDKIIKYRNMVAGIESYKYDQSQEEVV